MIPALIGGMSTDLLQQREESMPFVGNVIHKCDKSTDSRRAGRESHDFMNACIHECKKAPIRSA